MMIARVKFGRTHIVTETGDVFNGKQQIEILCMGTVELTAENKDRFKLSEGTDGHIACEKCRQLAGLDRDEEENAD